MARVAEERRWRYENDWVEVPVEGDRQQRVKLDYFSDEGHERVRFVTQIGTTERIDPLRLNDALRLNLRLPQGALALQGDMLVMVDTLPIRIATTDIVELSIRGLADAADHYERTMFGGDDH